MRRTIGRGGAAALLALLLQTTTARGDDAGVSPAATIRAVGPDRQAEAVLALFQGARAESPAAAMASWREATGDPNGVSRTAQALAAMFNPETAREWRTLRDASFSADLDADGRGRWSAVIPGDDGAVAALVASMRLSGGADEPPTPRGLPVRRLGGPGAALAVVSPLGVVLAQRRAELDAAIARLGTNQGLKGREADGPDGFHFDLRPNLLPAEPPAAWRSPVAALQATGARVADGVLGLRDDHLDLDLATEFDPTKTALWDVPPVDPGWLAWAPADATRAAVALAAGRDPGFWDAVFELADRADRADPARGNPQPLRVRLNLLAFARGVRPEADLWPRIRGVAAAWFAHPDGAVAAIVADSPADAERILRRVVQPLAPLLGGKADPAPAGEIAPLGRASGKPVQALARGNAVLIGWGEGALQRAPESAAKPERSLGPLVAADARPAGRVGVLRPELAPELAGYLPSTPLAATLAEAAPVVWRGGWSDGRAWDSLRWGDLKRVVARFLDRIPQAPPDAL